MQNVRKSTACVVRMAILLLISVCPGLLPRLADAAEDQMLGRFGDWESHKLPRGDKVVCYTLGIPKSKLPKNVNRDPTYVTVSYWTGRRASAEPSVTAGYPYRPGSKTTATIKKAQFEFFTKGDGAWIKRISDEARLVEAMKKGATMTVKGVSARGTQTTDIYSLIGFGAALERAARACR